jgi:HEAT repeat protein
MMDGLSELTAALATLNDELAQGKPGVDFLVLPDEEGGYQQTPLEERMRATIAALVAVLAGDPGGLTENSLERLCREIPRLQPGVDGFRARMTTGAGDFEDETSPIALATGRFVAGLKQALAELEAQDVFPLEALPRELLLTDVRQVVGNRETIRPLFLFLLPEKSKSFSRSPFQGWFSQWEQDVQERISQVQIASGSEDGKAFMAEIEEVERRLSPQSRALLVDRLLPLLKHPETSVKTRIYRLLEGIGGRDPDIFTIGLRSGKAENRLPIIDLLGDISGRLGSRERIDVFMALLQLLRDKDSALVASSRTVLRRLRLPDRDYAEILLNGIQSGHEEIQSVCFDLFRQVYFWDGAMVQFFLTYFDSDVPMAFEAVKLALKRLGSRAHGELSDYLVGRDSRLRLRALDIIQETAREAEELISPLCGLLSDPEPKVRESACRTLERIQFWARHDRNSRCLKVFQRKVVPLVRRLEADSAEEVRRVAGEVLQELDQEHTWVAIEPLLSGLKSPHETCRLFSVQTLGDMEKNALQAGSAIAELLEDPFFEVREKALWALGKIGQGSPETAGKVAHALRDAQSSIREMAAFALGGMGSAAIHVVPALKEAFHDPDVRVKEQVLRALVIIAPDSLEDLVGDIVAIYQSPKSTPNLRQVALESLGMIGSPVSPFLEIFSRALKHDEIALRRTAVLSIARFGQGGMVLLPNLWERLEDPSHDIRIASLAAIGCLDPASDKLLIRLEEEIAGSPIGMTSRWGESLVRAGKPAWEHLRFLLEHGSVVVRTAALGALALFEEPVRELLPQITSCLEDESPGVRVAALGGLAGFSTLPAEAWSRLLMLLNDDAEMVRRAVLDTLEHQEKPRPEVIAALVGHARSLSAASVGYRLGVIRCLGVAARFDSQARELLTGYSQDPDEELQAAARQILNRLEEG